MVRSRDAPRNDAGPSKGRIVMFGRVVIGLLFISLAGALAGYFVLRDGGGRGDDIDNPAAGESALDPGASRATARGDSRVPSSPESPPGNTPEGKSAINPTEPPGDFPKGCACVHELTGHVRHRLCSTAKLIRVLTACL